LRKLIIGGLAAGTLFAAPAIASAQPVNSIASGDWATSNSSVFKTPDGVHFGTYSDGGANGGTLRYVGVGAKHMQVKDLKSFSYTFNYKQAADVAGAAPYMRVFTDADGDGRYNNNVDNSIILDPSHCDSHSSPDQGVDLSLGTDNATFRYDDDGCEAGNQQTWEKIVADHGDEHIVMISVTQGYSAGTDVSAMLKNIKINGEQFDFDAPAQDGATGPQGPAGADGVAGANGRDGVTTVVSAQVKTNLVGAKVRTLHVAKHKRGMKLVSLKATLRGRKLPVKGNAITADLRNHTAGAYNVSITAKYGKGAKTHTVRSIRALSITNA
jgi:hypothetical protein